MHLRSLFYFLEAKIQAIYYFLYAPRCLDTYKHAIHVPFIIL